MRLPARRRSGAANGLPPEAVFAGDNRVKLLRGGSELFAAMVPAIDAARSQVWLATYIFSDDAAAKAVADALRRALDRGVTVRVVVDGFGSKNSIATLREWFGPYAHGPKPAVAVFRPLERWWAWFQPGQMRRLHHKLCVVDGTVGFVGGINLIDDCHDVRHGWTESPRLDFAVQVHGPIVRSIRQTGRALWTRAALGPRWRDEIMVLSRSMAPLARLRRLALQLRVNVPPAGSAEAGQRPMRAAFVVRDNLRQRRAIERSYEAAIQAAQQRVDIACPYFYPGQIFRRALRQAARRGVQVRLLLQGKIDYRIAGIAARVLYDELLAHGVQIHEYTPAFLHAKVAVIDGQWATVGSSNIDPLSLLLNLEANVVVQDRAFAASLSAEFDAALAQSVQVQSPPGGRGGWNLLRRGLVAWAANVYLRMAGITGRY
jgi:cardiolipin synthase A/B